MIVKTMMMVWNKKSGVKIIISMIVLYVTVKNNKARQRWKIYYMKLKVN